MKIAVIFPGIGYHVDKPLLYHSAKLAASLGYEVIKISYPECTINLKEADTAQIRDFAERCLKKTEEAFGDVNLDEAEDIVFISKSIGTVVAAAYSSQHEYNIRHVFFTPLAETFEYDISTDIIAFNGTSDNWADWKMIRKLCETRSIPITTVDNANHSLETGDVIKDIGILKETIETVRQFIRE